MFDKNTSSWEAFVGWSCGDLGASPVASEGVGFDGTLFAVGDIGRRALADDDRMLRAP